MFLVATRYLASGTGASGSGVAVAEGRSDQLVPHVTRSARLVLSIYSGYALVGSIALRLAGMSWFDAVNHAFCAVSTGGFSTRGASLGYFDSAAIEAVTIPLMVLGSTNFQIVCLMLRGRLRSTLRNAEVRTAGLLTAVAISFMFFFVTSSGYRGAFKQLRVAIFEVVSALTTTGFSTTTYSGWPAMGMLVLILLMIVGGGTGSTAGALKQYRAYLLTRGILWELRRLTMPARAIFDTSVWRGDGKVRVTPAKLAQTAAFAAVYLIIYVLGVGVLVGCGFGLEASLFEFASALGTVGLSVGVTGAGTPAPVLWAETVGMPLGRLEIFIVFVALRKLVADGAAVLRGKGK